MAPKPASRIMEISSGVVTACPQPVSHFFQSRPSVSPVHTDSRVLPRFQPTPILATASYEDSNCTGLSGSGVCPDSGFVDSGFSNTGSEDGKHESNVAKANMNRYIFFISSDNKIVRKTTGFPGQYHHSLYIIRNFPGFSG